MRIALILVFGFALLSGVAHADTSLDDLVLEALQNNSDLQEARERWQMVGHKVIPAGTLPDPQLSFALVNLPSDSLSFDETPMSGKDIKLTQKFPFPGKLGTKTQMAEYQALWYQHAWEDGRLQLAGQVKDAWYRLYFLDRAIDVTQKNLSILDDFVRLTETRYSVGKGLQQDVLKAQVERSNLMDKLFELRQQRATMLGRFNSLLNRPSSQPLQLPVLVSPETFNESLPQLQEQARQQRPLNAAYMALVDKFKAQRELAKLDYKPDFTVWGGYRFRENIMGDPVEGQDFVSGGISLNLPIWREKRGEQVAEADSAVRMARSQHEQFHSQVDFRLHDSYAQMEKNRDLTQLFEKGIIPQADQTFQATLAAYQVDKVDFLSLLDSLMKLYRYQIDYHRIVSDYQRNLAQLEAEAALAIELNAGPGAQAPK
jgi:outer membrane protein TolC